jgi:hypothetical protein
MMNFRVFVGRTLGTTFPIVVETSRESRTGVERWLELLRLDIQTGKLVSRSSYRLDSTPGKDMMTDTFTLLVATDGKKAFLIVSRPEGRPFEENGIRGIEGISHISLDSIDLESGVRKQIFSDRKDLWYLESNPIIGYCDKTSEILLDADSIIGVKVSPDPTVRTIFEMRRDSATSEPKDSSQGP